MPKKINLAPKTHQGGMERTKKRVRLASPDSAFSSQTSSASSSMLIDERADMPPQTKELADLLDVRSVSSHRDLDFKFGEIARSLMHDHLLVVRRIPSSTSTKSSSASEEAYELVEVEFYLRKDGHEDPFAHATSEQAVSGKWYFHKAPRKSSDASRSATSLKGYRGGTRKGVDLTFGGAVFLAHDSILPAPSTRGGILFRSIRRVSDGILISGPSLLVDELLRVSGAPTVGKLVADFLANDLSAIGSSSITKRKRCSVVLVPRSPTLMRRPVVYTSPRIGLDLSHPGTTSSTSDPRVIFVQKPYRFFIQPHLLAANGRVQTFLGLYTMLSDAEILSNESVLHEVARITGIKHTVAVKYVTELSRGIEKCAIQQFIGSAGKGASSSPAQYLRMMGALMHASQDAGFRGSEEV